jgi:hypothetical protein
MGLGLVVELAFHDRWGDSPPRLLTLFSLSAEANAPTWWASMLAAMCAVELARIARVRREFQGPHVVGFAALSAGFAFISFDEVAQLHEDLGLLLEGEGVFYFGWVKVALPLVVIVGLAFVPLLRSLSPRVRRRFAMAGALYVGGAVGMELPLGAWTDTHGAENLGYSLIDWLEESMELTALTWFAWTLRASRGELVSAEA